MTKLGWKSGLALSLGLLGASPLLAQAPTLPPSDTGDTGWIIAASALVLLMTLPGLALFYGGLVRVKSFLSVVLQCASIAALASLVWVGIGYTLAFGQVTNGWIGGGDFLMLSNLGTVRPGTAVPESTFALFQMTFAVITPALMVGAWVERARFPWVLGFCGLWLLIVYAPVAHWVWGGGWLATRFGTLDFAGGLVVHTTAAVSAIVVVLLLGPRKGFPEKPMLPHAPALTMVGAALLWVGWFGFNGGSALGANDNASSAILSTHIAASAAALTWLLAERIAVGKPTSIGWATGAIAGLATITPAAVFVSPGAAMLFGALAALVCYGAIQQIKLRWKVDDSLDVFAVHGVGGILGTLLLAVFISKELGGTGYFGGATMASQLGAQAIGISAVMVWSAVGSAIIALMVSVVFPMRVSEDDELEGLDISAHGERAWDFD
ncbi:ammonium transporter [uncultured Erythrobacter sp.]|uniref:ammonium transporter n=1 Tax=uncultured Erythrobacter sp. TaxID=263913 RepID=UPI00344DAD40